MSERATLPPSSLLREVFKYDPATGVITNVKTGARAFNTVTARGYRRGKFQKRPYLAHRIAWKMATGSEPGPHLDHINGNRSDNRLCNLREVTNKKNARNACLAKSNRSGINGVFWSKRSKKWCAQINVSGRRVHLGMFENIKDAAEARAKANKVYGFSERHGENI